MTAPTPSKVLALLRRREQLLYAKIILLLVIGLPFSLLGALMLGTMFWFTALLLGYGWPWSWFFGGLTALTVPLLYHLEIRQGRQYLGDAVQGEHAPSSACRALGRVAGPHMAMMAALVTNPRATAAGFVELFLWGPRQVVGAIGQLRAVLALRGVDRPRAADLLSRLAIQPKGCALTTLLGAGEKVAVIYAPLAYLAYHDWIGLSANCDRAWSLSQTRQTLGLQPV